jgi:hypothetical protein
MPNARFSEISLVNSRFCATRILDGGAQRPARELAAQGGDRRAQLRIGGLAERLRVARVEQALERGLPVDHERERQLHRRRRRAVECGAADARAVAADVFQRDTRAARKAPATAAAYRARS